MPACNAANQTFSPCGRRIGRLSAKAPSRTWMRGMRLLLQSREPPARSPLTQLRLANKSASLRNPCLALRVNHAPHGLEIAGGNFGPQRQPRPQGERGYRLPHGLEIAGGNFGPQRQTRPQGERGKALPARHPPHLTPPNLLPSHCEPRSGAAIQSSFAQHRIASSASPPRNDDGGFAILKVEGRPHDFAR